MRSGAVRARGLDFRVLGRRVSEGHVGRFGKRSQWPIRSSVPAEDIVARGRDLAVGLRSRRRRFTELVPDGARHMPQSIGDRRREEVVARIVDDRRLPALDVRRLGDVSVGVVLDTNTGGALRDVAVFGVEPNALVREKALRR